MVAFISKNWPGEPLESTSVIASLIGSTTTQKGLSLRCVLDENLYEKGIGVTDEELAAIHILNDAFHGDWNYTICRSRK
jgi:hypothetical protein